ncbi:MAG: FIST C-terminal domain-containing protein [Deltaproteobacteria bacterium]|jgi:hypothetical protein|nr:FIST C-terminal domain-containing protein [Deltaproteobacteria bacterium]
MIKTMVAYTKEIDDIDFAVEEMLGQLDLDSLLAETVGIAYCFADFVETDVVRAVCEKLPFRVIGATTIATAVNESDSPMIFGLLVLTSDDVKFRVCVTEELREEGSEEIIRRAYEKASEGMEERPVLLLSYFPLLSPTSGDFLVNTFSAIAPGIPMFGTLCVTLGDNFVSSRVIVDGIFHKSVAAMILVYGDVKPRFYLGNLYEEKLMKDKAVVTGVRGFALQTLNDTPARDVLTQMGLSTDSQGELLMPELFPLVVDFNDGTPPILRAMLKSFPDGTVNLAGEIPAGATLSVSSIDVREVQTVTERTLEAIEKEEHYDCALLHSCAARFYVAMEIDDELELKAIRKHLNDGASFIISYSAGEICPVKGRDNTFTNRMHNYAIIACVF